MPPGLTTIRCFYNQLTQLNNLPTSLKILYCSDNKITQLDNLPPNLKFLECYNNKLTQLNNLPESLEELHCKFGNSLTYKFDPTLKNIRKYNSRDKDISLIYL